MKNKQGFTLIEMTMTIAIGAILMGAVAVQAQIQTKATVENRNYLIAFNLARRQMAVVNNLTYPAVSAETLLTADSGFPDFIPTEEVTQIDTSGVHSLRQIAIRIRLGSISGPVLAALYAYRSDILTFGDGV